MWEFDFVKISDSTFDGMLNSMKNLTGKIDDKTSMEAYLKEKGVIGKTDKFLDVFITGKNRIKVYYKKNKNNA